MEFTINLNAYEVREAVKTGLLDAFACLEVQETPAAQEKSDAARQSRVVPTQLADPAAQQAVQPQPPQAPVQQPQAPVQQPFVPTKTATYTQEQLALAASQLMEAKKDQSVIIRLLAKFGVQALTQLPKEQYGAFAADLRSLGVKI